MAVDPDVQVKALSLKGYGFFVRNSYVSQPSSAPQGQPSASLQFVCSGCKTALIVPDSKESVSGPCPKCGAWIEASQIQIQDSPAKPLSGKLAQPGVMRKRSHGNAIGGRGRVRADGYLDHEYTERRELFGTLRVLAVSLAVLAVILFITLYLRQWMAG